MKTYQTLSAESGNVLFLILIAVALFAALSYAVTSSTNSGGGDANDESSLVNSAAITQYPASIKTAMIRQQISNGVTTPEASADIADAGDSFLFDKAPFTAIADAADEERAVFHPNGGGVSYTQGPASAMASGTATDWKFSMDFEVVNIGSSATGIPGNEIIAFLDGVTSSVCDRLNEEIGIGVTPVLATGITINHNLDEGDTILATNVYIGTTQNASLASLDGSPYGCFRNGTAGNYVYYHVLLDR